MIDKEISDIFSEFLEELKLIEAIEELKISSDSGNIDPPEQKLPTETKKQVANDLSL